MRHKVGQLVINKKLGLGKVLEVRGENVVVFFKDQTENPRTINVGVVPMALAKEQSDPYFDAAKPSKRRGSALPVKKKAARRTAGKPGRA